MKEVNDIQPSTSSTDVNCHSKNETNNRKRRASSTPETNSSVKRFIVQEEDDGTFKLLDFTDEVLLEILQHCDCTTLYALSKTCTRFLTLVQDRRLWKTFDFATKRLMGRRIKKLLSALQIGDIKAFKVRGFVTKCPSDKWKNNTITLNVLRKLSSCCPCLETIELRECYINFRKVKISDFPPLLKCLKFHGCQIALPRSPRLFTKIDDYLQLLEEISLEKCSWFETHDLVVFSKLPHLKRLSLRGCPTLKGCVPYGSIATRFGFKCLEYLDVRDTPISDSDIQCFNITTTLREILMDCPIEFRESYITTSDTDDSESFEPKPYNDESSKETKPSKEKPFNLSTYISNNSNSNSCASSSSKDTVSEQQQEQKQKREESNASISDTEESDSDDDSDCSTDSENDSSDDDENGGDKVSGSNADANQPHQAHCIQVILQNGRMINVNAERSSNDFDNPLRETNGLRCVIGIINGRDSNDPTHRVFAAPFRYQRQQQEQQQQLQLQQQLQQQQEQQQPGSSSSYNNNNQPEQHESIAQQPTVKISIDPSPISESINQSAERSKTPGNESENATSTNKNDDDGGGGGSSDNQPGPSGLQTNQNDSTNASKSNSQSTMSSNDNAANVNDDEAAGPSNRQPLGNKPSTANAENRQRLIIVQHRRSQNNDENGNQNRQISWEVRNLYPISDTPFRRYQNPMLNGIYNGNYITDRGMCSFGMPRRSVQEGIIWIRAERRAPDTLLERITVRNYLDVTDVTLRHLALCAPNLRYLDVTGTSVTLKGITQFLKEKPECQVISELLDT